VTQCGNECPMFTLDSSRTSKRHNRPLVARTSGITGAAQRPALELPTCAACFDKKASDRQVTARLTSAQTGPVTVLYGRSGCHIQALARRSGDCAQALDLPTRSYQQECSYQRPMANSGCWVSRPGARRRQRVDAHLCQTIGEYAKQKNAY
jgi:hypothetical protein